MSDMKEAEAFERWAKERGMTPGMVYWRIAKEAWEAGAAFASESRKPVRQPCRCSCPAGFQVCDLCGGQIS